MEHPELIDQLFDHKMLAILRLFFKEPKKEFYLREISQQSKVALASTFRIMHKLMKMKIVKQIKVSKFKVYQLGTNEHVDFLSSLVAEKKEALSEFIREVKKLPEVSMIILHGEESENNASVMIIGEKVDAIAIQKIVATILEQYDFTIKYLPLDSEQFNQMNKIGLYSGKKKVLWEK